MVVVWGGQATKCLPLRQSHHNHSWDEETGLAPFQRKKQCLVLVFKEHDCSLCSHREGLLRDIRNSLSVARHRAVGHLPGVNSALPVS